MERVMLTPLTPEEQQFAADNYECLQRCIRSQRLDQGMSDVAALGYIHAVKKWFARSDLHKWTFRAIAHQTIRSHVSNERCKQGRRIQVVSLDAEVPGTDGFTYGQIITAEHMNYLKGDALTMAMKVNYDVKVPEIARMSTRISVEVETLLNFLSSNHNTMSIELGDKKEATRVANNLRSWKKNHKREDFKIYRFEESIYIEKQKGKGKNG
ncbi:hypothetical protein [Enterocloster citroniae]|uniref:hypothetical protein n=1 Tax=Enterocloster citroniae TaxID=358743 RepID=UPI003052CA60|nr:hypothetical protein [Enterocloster citroniae]